MKIGNQTSFRRSTRIIPMLVMSLLTVLSTGCDKIQEILDPDKDPVTIATAIRGIWEVVGYEIPENSYLTKDEVSGNWQEITDSAYSEKIDKTTSPYYSIIKFTDAAIICLEGGKIFDIVLAEPYPYTLSEDSVITSPFLKSDYATSIWKIKEMTSSGFVLEHFEEGRKNVAPGNADTISLGTRLFINLRRLR